MTIQIKIMGQLRASFPQRSSRSFTDNAFSSRYMIKQILKNTTLRHKKDTFISVDHKTYVIMHYIVIGVIIILIK